MFLAVGFSQHMTICKNSHGIAGKFLNGHLWHLLNDSQKIIHTTGIEEGFLLFYSQIEEDRQIPPELMDALNIPLTFESSQHGFPINVWVNCLFPDWIEKGE